MLTHKNIPRLGYTVFLTVIYAMFFFVHSFAKLSYCGVGGVLRVQQISKFKEDTFPFAKVTPVKKEAKPNVRLNKRFHPEEGFVLPDEMVFTVVDKIDCPPVPTFYNNPLQSVVCLHKSLRAPPVIAS
jgi:hypothetical protein